MSQCFPLLLGEAVVFKEENGLTSSGNAKQGEIHAMSKDNHILRLEVYI